MSQWQHRTNCTAQEAWSGTRDSLIYWTVGLSCKDAVYVNSLYNPFNADWRDARLKLYGVPPKKIFIHYHF